MASKITLIDPVVGSSPGGPGGWGDTLNTNFNNISNAIGSTQYINVGSGDVVLTSTQASAGNITVVGATQARNIYLPQNTVGSWYILNSTGYNITVYMNNGSGAPAGLGTTIPFSQPQNIFSDNGSNAFPANVGVYPGTIIFYGGIGAPPGYLACDGAAYSRTTYSYLFASIGTYWGAGDGSTTFNVPNLQGMFLRGTGTNSAYPTAIGPLVGQYQADKILAHTHTDAGHTHVINQVISNQYGNTGGNLVQDASSSPSPKYVTQQGYANIQSTGTPDSNPKNFGVFYCIKF